MDAEGQDVTLLVLLKGDLDRLVLKGVHAQNGISESS
jgi:hypothetical protein